MQKISLWALFIIGGLMFTACKHSNKSNQSQNAPQHTVLTMQPQTRTLSEAYSCVIVGNMDVAIRPKITAFIDRQIINEGDFVKKGELMFVLDDVQIQANVNVAKASLKVAEAQLETSNLTLKTKKELYDRQIISEYELQLAQNEVKVKESSLAQAKANLINAQKELEYTRITSPADGIVGVINMSPGNLIGPNSEKPITQVSEVRVMRAYFSMSEKQALTLSRQYGSFQNTIKQMPAIKLQLSDGTMFNHMGKVITISGSVDNNTGAIRTRVDFPNPEYTLKSGYTGTILIPYKMDSIFVIPQKATFEIQDKKFVYVVDPNDNSVDSRPIEIHTLNDGQSYVVLKGLNAGENIVIEGATFLKDGQIISPVVSTDSTDAKKSTVTAQIRNK